MTKRRAVLSAIAGLALVGSLTALATEDDAEGSDLVTYGPAEHPAAVTDPLLRKVGGQAAELVDFNDEMFLGSYLSEDGTVVIVASSKAGEDLAGSTNFAVKVELQRAPIALREVPELGEEVRALTPHLTKEFVEWGADPESGGIQVVVGDELTDDDREAIERFAEERNLPITVEIVPGLGPAHLD